MLHKHHIIPRYAGGLDTSENIVTLTIEEHAEAHRLLWIKNGDRRDFLAWQMLSKRMSKKNLVLEWCSMGGKSRLGVPRTEETRKKISSSKTGTKLSDKHKQSISTSMMGNKSQLGLKRNDDTKLKMRLSHLGKKHSNESRKKRSEIMKKVWKLKKGAQNDIG